MTREIEGLRKISEYIQLFIMCLIGKSYEASYMIIAYET